MPPCRRSRRGMPDSFFCFFERLHGAPPPPRGSVVVVCCGAGRGLVREVGGIVVGQEEGEEDQAREHDRLRPIQGL